MHCQHLEIFLKLWKLSGKMIVSFHGAVSTENENGGRSQQFPVLQQSEMMFMCLWICVHLFYSNDEIINWLYFEENNKNICS
jgi:hypothetical protein